MSCIPQYKPLFVPVVPVVNIRLLNHLNVNSILHNNQFAYQKSRSTEMAAIKLCNDVLNGFDSNRTTVAVFLDLSRAFDCVDHKILIEKLKFYGINDVSLRWFTDYLTDRSEKVIFNNTESNWLPLTAGVPQASILGPILFLLYVNDMLLIDHLGDTILFADDTTNYESGVNVYEVIRTINRNLKLLREWFIANKLSVNVLKTEALIFSRKNLYYPLPPIIFDMKPIPYSHHVKFLGINLDTKLNWKLHITSVRNKLSSACNVLNNIRRKLNTHVAKKLYYTLAYSHITYGNLLWSSACRTNLEPVVKAQNRLIKIVAKQGAVDNILPIYKELQILTFLDVCSYNISLYVFKVLHNLLISPFEFIPRVIPAYILRNPTVLTIPNLRTDQSRRFIYYRGCIHWNNLPNVIRESVSLNSIKCKLRKYFIDQYY